MAMSFVPGARKVLDEAGVQLADLKGRPLWKMPEPSRTVKHYVNAGQRRKGFKPSKEVPIYRGIPIRIANLIRAQIRKAARAKMAEDAKEKE